MTAESNDYQSIFVKFASRQPQKLLLSSDFDNDSDILYIALLLGGYDSYIASEDVLVEVRD